MKIQKIAVGGFILNREGKFLIVKRAHDDDFLPNYWELPGGKVEFGEDPEMAVIRELQEETGLDVVVEFPLKALSYIVQEAKTKERHYVEISYYCRMKDPEQNVNISHEHQDFAWTTFETLPDEKISQLMSDLLASFANNPQIKRRE